MGCGTSSAKVIYQNKSINQNSLSETSRSSDASIVRRRIFTEEPQSYDYNTIISRNSLVPEWRTMEVIENEWSFLSVIPEVADESDHDN